MFSRKQSSDGDDVSVSSGNSFCIDSDVTSDDGISMKSENGDDDLNETSEEKTSKTFDSLVDALETVCKQDKDKIKVHAGYGVDVAIFELFHQQS